MTDRTGRILLVVGAATIRMALIATVLACIAGARVVHAQAAPPPSWGDVGVSWSPVVRLEYLDRPYGRPPGVWVTWGAGKFRLQMEYVRSRLRSDNAERKIENHQGQEIPVYRAARSTNVYQVGAVAVHWRFMRDWPVSPHVLFGLQYLNIAHRPCVAPGDPVQREPNGRYRVDFAEGEEQRCVDDPVISRHRVFPVIGGGIDIPLGTRVFARAQVQIFQVRLGVGVRF